MSALTAVPSVTLARQFATTRWAATNATASLERRRKIRRIAASSIIARLAATTASTMLTASRTAYPTTAHVATALWGAPVRARKSISARRTRCAARMQPAPTRPARMRVNASLVFWGMAWTVRTLTSAQKRKSAAQTPNASTRLARITANVIPVISAIQPHGATMSTSAVTVRVTKTLLA